MLKHVYIIAISLLVATSAFAQQVNIDLGKIDSNTAAKILEAKKYYEAQAEKEKVEKEKAKEPAVTADNVAKWAEVGKQLSAGVAETARGLSIEVNEFAKTPVGMATFFIIAWKFFGAKVWTVFAATMIWAIFGTIIWRSFSYFHRLQKRVVSVENGKTTYEYVEYPWNKTKDAKLTSAVIHVVVFCILSLVMIIAIL
jgi:hypothetical protein